MQNNKWVCICTAYYYPHFGGVERYAENMAEYLIKEGYKVVILTTGAGYHSGWEEKENLIICRLPLIKLLHDRFPIPAFFSKDYRQLLSKLKEFDFSLFVLNTRFYLTTWIGLILSAKKTSKAIVIEHGTGHIKTGNFFLDHAAIVYEHFISWYQRVLFKPLYYGVSEACNRWLMHFGIKASGVIYNGIDAEQIPTGKVHYREMYNVPADAVVFTFAGRLIAEKGVLFILDVFSGLIHKHRNACLFIAGTGPLIHEVEKYHNSNIIVLNKLEHSEVMNLLSQTDVVLIPSVYPEGLPTLILEAGLAKCAVITTDRGGAGEIIIPEKTGILIHEQDHLKFFHAMETMIVQSDERNIYRMNLHNLVISKFSWGVIIVEVLKLINSNRTNLS